ncbi:MAG: hypothetical protein FWB96_10460 [Defluviitaleaceae bacterium]|nr:hypothetical protein [Defluviitaleaceae bacterium]MCL2263645.1 hypothetical protein [Defluviitaleaceae bacterium]
MPNVFHSGEKDACLPVIDTILKAAETARRSGVLFLEKFAQAHGNDFLSFAIMLIVDGTKPATVRDILETLTDSDNHMGSAFLERKIITEGVLLIQAGENPRIIEMKLLAILGERYLRERGHYPFFDPAVAVDRRISQLTQQNPSTLFCHFIARLPDENIAQVMKDVGQRDLGIAVSGCEEYAAKLILQNVPIRTAEMVLNDMEYMSANNTLTMEEITITHRKIMGMFKAKGLDDGEL